MREFAVFYIIGSGRVGTLSAIVSNRGFGITEFDSVRRQAEELHETTVVITGWQEFDYCDAAEVDVTPENG